MSLSRPGLWDQSGGLRQLHHERHHSVGRCRVISAEGRGAPGSADEEQQLHATGVGAPGRSDHLEQLRCQRAPAREA